MQSPKPKARTLEVPGRKPLHTPRAVRQGKPQGSDSESVLTPTHRADKTLKTINNKSSLSPSSEKIRNGRVSDADSQIVKLQEELKKAKEMQKMSESLKWQAEQEKEETKRQLLAVTSDLNESRRYLFELSASEDERILELRKISQDRDRAWQSELEAVQRQHSMDSSALASAMNELHKLKLRSEKVAESAQADIHSLRMELEENFSLVKNLRAELSDCRDSEARSMEILRKTRMQLETANTTIENLRSNGSKAVKAFNSLSFELEQSKDRVKTLERVISKLQADLEVDHASMDTAKNDQELEKINDLEAELNSLRSEASRLRSALDAAELRYQEEYIRNNLQIGNAYDEIEFLKSESCRKQAEFEDELAKATAQIAIFIDKEARKNEGESEFIKELKVEIEELKTILVDKETELHSVIEKNEILKMEMEEEIERKIIKAQLTNQLEAAQAANLEMESELKRLKVQLDQWRKAAELAASMLSDGNDGKSVKRTSSFDVNYSIGLPLTYVHDLDEDSPKKKYANMLKKMGVLWKKGQK